MTKETLEKLKLGIECIAIILAGVFGFYKFIYEDYIVPNSYAPYILTEGMLKKVSENNKEDDSVCFVQMNLKIENNSHKRINILFLKYQIKGINYSKGSNFINSLGFNINYDKKNWALYNDDRDGSFIAEYTACKIKIIECGTFFQSNWLDQGDKDNRTLLIAVSKKYNSVCLTTNLFYTKNDVPENLYQNQMITKDCELENYFSIDNPYSKNDFEKDSNFKIKEISSDLSNKYDIVTSTSQYELLINPKLNCH